MSHLNILYIILPHLQPVRKSSDHVQQIDRQTDRRGTWIATQFASIHPSRRCLNVDVSIKASTVTGLCPPIGLYFEMRSELTVLDDDARWSIDTRDHRSSGIRRFVMTHSNVIYSTFHLLSRRCGWWAFFPHCPAIAQITLSSVKLRRLIAVLLYWLRLSCNTKRILCSRKEFVSVGSSRVFLFMLFRVILNSNNR